MLNQFVWSEGEMPLLAKVREIAGRTAVLQTLRDYGHGKNAVWESRRATASRTSR